MQFLTLKFANKKCVYSSRTNTLRAMKSSEKTETSIQSYKISFKMSSSFTNSRAFG